MYITYIIRYNSYITDIIRTSYINTYVNVYSSAKLEPISSLPFAVICMGLALIKCYYETPAN